VREIVLALRGVRVIEQCLHRIGLGVFEEHQSAIRCYEKIGFKLEGRLRDQMFQAGEYKNQLWMGLLRAEYKPLRTGQRK